MDLSASYSLKDKTIPLDMFKINDELQCKCGEEK